MITGCYGDHSLKIAGLDTLGQADNATHGTKTYKKNTGRYFMRHSSRHTTGIAMAVLCLSWLPDAQAYTVFIDELIVTKNGSAFFTDSFDDASPPPDGPGTREYTVSGGFGPETGGKLTLNSDDAVCGINAFGNNRCIQRAILKTNTDSSDLAKGLKIDDTFSITGLFDLTDPAVIREKYGIRLTDRGGPDGTPPNGNDIIEVAVRRNSGNLLTVRLRRLDLANGISTEIETLSLNLSLGDQIALMLSRETTLSNAVTASFSYVNSGVFGTPIEFSAKPDIFNGESFTRAAFVATTPVPVPAAILLFASGLVGLAGISRKRKAT